MENNILEYFFSISLESHILGYNWTKIHWVARAESFLPCLFWIHWMILKKVILVCVFSVMAGLVQFGLKQHEDPLSYPARNCSSMSSSMISKYDSEGSCNDHSFSLAFRGRKTRQVFSCYFKSVFRDRTTELRTAYYLTICKRRVIRF